MFELITYKTVKFGGKSLMFWIYIKSDVSRKLKLTVVL